MKSVVITLLMFFVVFSLVSFNVLNIVDNSIFSYLVRIIFVLVLLSAVVFVGVPQNKYTAPLQKFIHRFQKVKAKPQAKKQKTAQKSKSTAKRRGKNV